MGPGLWQQRDKTEHLLENSQVRVRLSADNVCGLSLDSVERIGGATWTNWEALPWRAVCMDTNRPEEELTFEVHPHVRDVQNVFSDGTVCSAVWNTKVGGVDTLRVQMTFRLVEDWVELSTNVEWSGTPTRYSLQNIAFMPLRIPPRDQGNDMACLAAIKGMGVRDPIYRFRYTPWDPDQPLGRFSGRTKNWAQTGTGKSMSMPLWGYYSEQDFEGWMTWQEDWDDSLMYGEYQSDGEAMVWDQGFLQPDWLEVGNNGQVLGTTSKLCFRPPQGKHADGTWWDISEHYRSRIETLKPGFAVPKFRDDPSLKDEQRKPHLWMYLDYDGNPTVDPADDMLAAVQVLRDNLLPKEKLPIFAISRGDPLEVKANKPWSPTTSSFRAGHLPLRELGCFVGYHTGDSPSTAPQVLSEDRWAHPQYAPTTDWWTDNDGLAATRVSRQGRIDGDTESTRGAGSSDGGYWQTRDYVVQAWDQDTLTLTVQGTITEDWDTKNNDVLGIALRIETEPGSGIYARGNVTSHTGTKFVLDSRAGLVDYRGISASPKAGETITIYDQTWDHCMHALANHAIGDAVADQVWGGQTQVFNAAYHYHDVAPALGFRGLITCNGRHQGLSGYAGHPQGGGTWWKKGYRDFWTKMRERSGATWICAEYLDEAYLDSGMNMGLHGAGYLTIWRGIDTDLDDFDEHKIVALPMFATVHAGRAWAMNFTFAWGNGILGPFSRNGNVIATGEARKLRRQQSYWCFGEWVYGQTPIVYNHVSDPLTNASDNVWNDDEYTGSNAADEEIERQRDLFTAVALAEQSWLPTWFRNGEIQRPVPLGASTTRDDMKDYGWFGEVNVGFPFNFDDRTNGTVLYPTKNHPRVIHCPWKDPKTGSLMILFMNCTNNTGTWQGTVTFADYGLTGEVAVLNISADGSVLDLGTYWTSFTLLGPVTSYTMTGLLLAKPEDLKLFDGIPLESQFQMQEDRQKNRFVHDRLRDWGSKLCMRLLDGEGVKDVSGASLIQVRTTSPTGVNSTATASAQTDGKDGLIERAMGLADLGELGVWQATPIVDGVEGSAVDFSVEEILN